MWSEKDEERYYKNLSIIAGVLFRNEDSFK